MGLRNKMMQHGCPVGLGLAGPLKSNWRSPNRQTSGRELKRLCHANLLKLEGKTSRAQATPKIIAALCADGTSEIGNIRQIDRGYERIDERLHALGASIERTEL